MNGLITHFNFVSSNEEATMFKVNSTGAKIQGQLVYTKREYSFDFKPARAADIILMIGYLNLGIDSETMLAQQVWGYNPYTAWSEKKLSVPNSLVGELCLEKEFQAGSSKKLVENEQWASSYDTTTGWICIGDDRLSQNDIAIEFATNTIISLIDGRIKAIWLKPVFDSE